MPGPNSAPRSPSRAGLGSLLLAMVLFAAACGGAATPASGKPAATTTAAAGPVAPNAQRNQVVVMQGVDANSLDPAFTTATTDTNVVENVMEGLVGLDAQDQVVPLLATSWNLVNPTTWRFTLRAGVHFQDGEALDAAAVKYSFDRMADPALKARVSALKEINFAAAKVVNATTVDIVTKTPEPLLLQYLPQVYILPPTYYQSHPESYLASHPMGTGPYRFVSWVRNQAITLQAWSGYWGTPAPIKSAIFKPEPEVSTQMDSLKLGETDIITGLTPDQLATVKAFPDATVKAVQSGRDVFIGISTTRPYLADPRVRQALNYAVDWASIQQSLLHGYGQRMGSIVIGHNVNPAVQPYPYDPAKARALLAAANFPMGQQLVLDTPTGRYTDDQQIAQVVASDLQKVGLAVTVRPLAWPVYVTMRNVKRNPDDLWLLGLGSSYTAQQNLDYVSPQLFVNVTGWNDPQYNSLFAQLSQTFDPAKRKQLAYQLQTIVHDQAPWIFLWQQYDFYGVNKQLNWQPRSDEAVFLQGASWAKGG